MSTQSSLFPPPAIDAVSAAEAMPAKSSYLIIGDQIEQLLGEVDLARLDPSATQSASTLAVLALVTVFQFVENLPDRRAAEATRTRLDWKYALHLPWTYPGLEPSLLCEFRRSLVRDRGVQQVFQQLLDCLAETELLRDAGRWPIDASKVLAAVCGVSRLERLMEAMRMVLEALAAVAPEQLRAITLPHWYERYSQMQALRVLPKSLEEQVALAQAIGSDAIYLLEAMARTASHLTLLPEVETLHQIWLEQFERSGQQLQWRTFACASCCSL
jgi:transposase